MILVYYIFLSVLQVIRYDSQVHRIYRIVCCRVFKTQMYIELVLLLSSFSCGADAGEGVEPVHRDNQKGKLQMGWTFITAMERLDMYTIIWVPDCAQPDRRLHSYNSKDSNAQKCDLKEQTPAQLFTKWDQWWLGFKTKQIVVRLTESCTQWPRSLFHTFLGSHLGGQWSFNLVRPKNIQHRRATNSRVEASTPSKQTNNLSSCQSSFKLHIQKPIYLKKPKNTCFFSFSARDLRWRKASTRVALVGSRTKIVSKFSVILASQDSWMPESELYTSHMIFVLRCSKYCNIMEPFTTKDKMVQTLREPTFKVLVLRARLTHRSEEAMTP